MKIKNLLLIGMCALSTGAFAATGTVIYTESFGENGWHQGIANVTGEMKAGSQYYFDDPVYIHSNWAGDTRTWPDASGGSVLTLYQATYAQLRIKVNMTAYPYALFTYAACWDGAIAAYSFDGGSTYTPFTGAQIATYGDWRQIQFADNIGGRAEVIIRLTADSGTPQIDDPTVTGYDVDIIGDIFSADFSTCSHALTTILLNTTNTIKWQRSADNEQSWSDIACTSSFYTETDPEAGEYIYRALNGDGAYSNYVKAAYYDAVPSEINTLPLASASKKVDESVTFSLELTDNRYSYQWYKGSALINGATENTYSIPVLKTSNAGIYHCQVWNGCNRISSTNSMLIVDKAPQVITLPATLVKTFSESDFDLPKTTDKNQTIAYTSSNPAVATVTGNRVHIAGLGNTTISASQAGNSEYIPATPASLSLTVTKGQQTITFNPLPGKTYGDAAITLQASVTTGRTVTYESSNTNVATVSGNTLTLHNAGTATITAFSAGDGSWDDAPPVQRPLTVTKAPLTATADNKSRNYGDNNPSLTVSYQGFLKSDTQSSLAQAPTAICQATKISEVGDYPILLTDGNSQNYDITLRNGTLTVTKAPVTVTAQSASSVYGEEPPPAYTCQYSGFKNGETEAVLTSAATVRCSATATSGAGDYSIIPSGASAKNYSFTYQNGTLTISKRPLSVTPNTASRRYGDATPAFTLSYSGFVNGNTASVITTPPTATTAATTNSAAGNHIITCSGGNAANYSFTYGTGTLTVTKAPLTIIANNTIRKQGDPNPVFTFFYLGFKNGENYSVLDELPTATCVANKNSITGFYEITLSGGKDNNYSYTFINGTLEVIPADDIAIQDASLDGLRVYPNPVSRMLYVESDEEISRIVIYNVGGSVVLQSAYTDSGIDVSALPGGIYLIKIIMGKEVSTQRFLKE